MIGSSAMNAPLAINAAIIIMIIIIIIIENC